MDLKGTSTPATSVKLTVRRMQSGSTTSTNQPASRLSHQTSDVSDISTTTPVTPAPAVRDAKFHPPHVRQQHQDNESSSCSSTEALNQQSDDVWNDNPLYTDQRRQRKSRRTRHIAVDTGPLDDFLAGDAQPGPKQFTRSEPDITAAVNTLIVHDVANTPKEFDVCHGSMIDCISVAAPDDTVIKPSQLRASMRQRFHTTSLADDSNKLDIGSDAPSRHDTRRGGSFRETKQTTPALQRGTAFVRSKTTSSSSATAAVFSPSTVNGQQTSVSCSSQTKSPSSSSSSCTFSFPPSADAHRKTVVQSPSFPRTAAYPASSAKTANGAAHEDNGVESLSYDQLLHQFNEVLNIVVDHICINLLGLEQPGCRFY